MKIRAKIGKESASLGEVVGFLLKNVQGVGRAQKSPDTFAGADNQIKLSVKF
jgi:hypothetical protein